MNTQTATQAALRIADELKKRGPVTFESFMEKALYDPDFGYYANNCAEIGKTGDFYTSPAVHGAFGETLARLISVLRRRIEPGSNGKLAVLEAGGGNGRLALDILSALARTDPETYKAVEYTVVDRCKPQKCAVGNRHANFHRVESFADITEPGSGIVLSNELFDAIPFHRLVFRGGEIKEIFVSYGEDGFAEIEGSVSTDEINRYFEKNRADFVEGQRFEVCLKSADMLKQMATALKKGVVLTIDYGFQTKQLFSPARIGGTFKCVSGHKISESPFENIGMQDITAHVDFGNLQKTGEAAGLETLKYTTQAQFLVDWGIMEIAEQNPDGILSVKNLFMPEMMGGKFRVLMQTKNADELKEGFYPESPLRISFGVD